MKTKAYIRIARDDRGKPRIGVGAQRNNAAITNSLGGALPTVMFAVEFDIPDAAFDRASQVIATVEITNPEIAATIKQVKE